MTHEQFKMEVAKFLDNVQMMIVRKNDDYAGESSNAFEAFEAAANVLGLTREQVWAVFYMKHVQAVVRYINSGKLTSESIQQRLTDLAAYPAILNAMIEESS